MFFIVISRIVVPTQQLLNASFCTTRVSLDSGILFFFLENRNLKFKLFILVLGRIERSLETS